VSVLNISSRENKLIRHISRLAANGKYRAECGEYVCEGEKLLREAITCGAEIKSVLWEAQSFEKRADAELLDALESRDCRVATAQGGVFGAASTLETFAGPVFVCGIPEHDGEVKPGCYIALDAVQDPGNVGTIIRSADAFNIDGVFLLPGAADAYAPKTVRAAMGSLFRVSIYKVSADKFFRAMDAAETPVYTAALTDGAANIRDINLSRAAVIIGNEGNGVNPANIARAAGSVIIPMPGRAESLNAAVAASIIMWEMSGCH
jgi:TrmH family RNA methyltransferase